MRDIAQSIGLTAPAIYNHYASKQLLLVAAVDYILSDFLIAVLDDLEEFDGTSERFYELVRRHAYYMTSRLETATANEHLLEPDFMARTMPRDAADRFRAARRAYTHIVRELISEVAPNSGEVNDVVRTFAVVSVMNYVYWWYRSDGSLRPEEVAADTCRLVASMLGEPGSVPSPLRD
jgi:AcrR family transcriptional regulator